MSFDSYAIDPRCLRILHEQKLVTPTPVQAQAIPVALEGRDLVAVAQTGTGKTLAFGLPALTRLASGKGPRRKMLILTPTRELAIQINTVLHPFAKALGLRTLCVYGGAGMDPQAQGLRRGCEVIVATPGRLLDHMARGNARFDNLDILVFDEADRMLDMGFMPDIRRIVKAVPEERQTLMFSATFDAKMMQATREFLTNPAEVRVATSVKAADAVRQGVYTVHSTGKMDLLSRILTDHDVTSAIVFIRTKYRTDRVAKALHQQGFKAQAIHGGRTQGQRQKALDGFRRGHFNVLVATDVAARGIDVKGISHVFNFDIPMTPDDYIHRIGRTARASASGDAITFVSPEDHEALYQIEQVIGRQIPQIEWEGAIEMPVRGQYRGGQRSGGRPQGNRNGGGGNRSRFGRPQGTANRNDRSARPQASRSRDNDDNQRSRSDSTSDRPYRERQDSDSNRPARDSQNDRSSDRPYRGGRDESKRPAASANTRGGFGQRNDEDRGERSQPRRSGNASGRPQGAGRANDSRGGAPKRNTRSRVTSSNR